ncbi:MAG: potassium transporter TrkG [Pseudomonadota bacterium]
MHFAPVFRFVAYTHFGVSAAMVVPIVLSMAAGGETAAGFVAGLLVACLIGGLCFVTAKGLSHERSVRNGFRELLLSLLIFWTILPMTAAIPLAVNGQSYGEALFEAISAITTTGAWLSEPAARATAEGMLYRASLQALGGLVSLATAAAVFVRPEFVGIAPQTPPFARGETGSYLRAFGQALRVFGPVYATATLLGGALLILASVPAVEAATMAMSFLATGGLVPQAGGIGAYPPAAIGVSAILMALGAVNFVMLAVLILGQTGRLRQGQDIETRTFLLLLPFVALLFWLSKGAGDLDRILQHLFNAVSILSTNGPILGEAPGLAPIMVTAIIGGAAVSTAGGIKLLRWLIAIRRTGQEVWKLTHPGAVLRSKPSTNELGVWIHALAFAILLAMLVLVTAFYGYPLETSAAVAVAVISNTGPLLDAAPLMTADYAVFDPSLRVAFALGMVAGRLELVVLLVVLNRHFWQG